MPYYPTMPDLANCCLHYPKIKKQRDPPEDNDSLENHHLQCVIFGHNWKFQEERWRIDADRETDDLENFRLIGIIRRCKMCGGIAWEYFPHDRFKHDDYSDEWYDEIE
ncbi:hypothetical protein BD31_I0916 [Candidatus Nitrosopumilus salaria BD31]|uniref:Uncharacterized protein n=1 Tax=Candidatus Nitrosopumilus salarius BD31 TaxID=859350 RepID=I3CZM5_9ARCH|nr:hypothetical protein [Candidatus Nitrosopumilus salaria]EIJ64918.1 hypothetical protein BD31_I0916 [Candidatus Nitrosopumilus salaria BD31]